MTLESGFERQIALAGRLFTQSIEKEVCLKWLCRICSSYNKSYDVLTAYHLPDTILSNFCLL